MPPPTLLPPSRRNHFTNGSWFVPVLVTVIAIFAATIFFGDYFRPYISVRNFFFLSCTHLFVDCIIKLHVEKRSLRKMEHSIRGIILKNSNFESASAMKSELLSELEKFKNSSYYGAGKDTAEAIHLTVSQISETRSSDLHLLGLVPSLPKIRENRMERKVDATFSAGVIIKVGLLGTFLGISIALAHTIKQLNSIRERDAAIVSGHAPTNLDANGMQVFILDLLTATTTKFYTSAYGLSLSITLVLLDRSIYRHQRNNLLFLSSRYIDKNAKHWAKEDDSSAKRVIESLEKATSDLLRASETNQETVDKLVAGIIHGLNSVFVNAREEIIASVRDSMDTRYNDYMFSVVKNNDQLKILNDFLAANRSTFPEFKDILVAFETLSKNQSNEAKSTN